MLMLQLAADCGDHLAAAAVVREAVPPVHGREADDLRGELLTLFGHLVAARVQDLADRDHRHHRRGLASGLHQQGARVLGQLGGVKRKKRLESHTDGRHVVGKIHHRLLWGRAETLPRLVNQASGSFPRWGCRFPRRAAGADWMGSAHRCKQPERPRR